jgi:hypothetical protein
MVATFSITATEPINRCENKGFCTTQYAFQSLEATNPRKTRARLNGSVICVCMHGNDSFLYECYHLRL